MGEKKNKPSADSHCLGRPCCGSCAVLHPITSDNGSDNSAQKCSYVIINDTACEANMICKSRLEDDAIACFLEALDS